MPHLPSSKKRLRQAGKRRKRNLAWKRKAKEAIREFKKLIEKGKKKKAEKQLRKVQEILDKEAQRGIIHKNKAARVKSQLSKLLYEEEKD